MFPSCKKYKLTRARAALFTYAGLQGHESGSKNEWVETAQPSAKNAWMEKHGDYCSVLWYSGYI